MSLDNFFMIWYYRLDFSLTLCRHLGFFGISFCCLCIGFGLPRIRLRPLCISFRCLSALHFNNIGRRDYPRIALTDHGALCVLAHSPLIVLLQQAFVLIVKQWAVSQCFLCRTQELLKARIPRRAVSGQFSLYKSIKVMYTLCCGRCRQDTLL